MIVGPDLATVGALVRLTRTEPGLRAVWLRTYDEAEPAFARARALDDRAGLPAGALRPPIQAAMSDAALRAAVEHHAWHADDTTTDPATTRAEPAEAIRSALVAASEGLT